ncbi:DUF998 domain-containing protein [Flavisolibacter tropicus]|uniref:DUF998 domain-containing protein n=1 Tax=Flavisolibacter tropicus TaxID=1492898 RepID=UPI001314E515|nr:DUF998 domain-containing protein [Flavisolibacter tropicus]
MSSSITTTHQWSQRTRSNNSIQEAVHKGLLLCGLLSSLLYVTMNVFIPMLYAGYNAASQTVSELSAIDAPTRPLWVWLGFVYTFLVAGFGWGVWQSAPRKRPLGKAGILIIAHGIVGLAWPLAPMHQRQVLAAGGGSFTDTLHIVFSMVTVLIMLFTIAFAAASLGNRFRLYSIVTVLLLLITGILTGLDAPRMEAGQPTPLMGVWERISIGAYMLWVMVLAVILLWAERKFRRK